jgi:hypothetical protein
VLDFITKLHEQQFGKQIDKPAPQPQKEEKKNLDARNVKAGKEQ